MRPGTSVFLYRGSDFRVQPDQRFCVRSTGRIELTLNRSRSFLPRFARILFVDFTTDTNNHSACFGYSPIIREIKFASSL